MFSTLVGDRLHRKRCACADAADSWPSCRGRGRGECLWVTRGSLAHFLALLYPDSSVARGEPGLCHVPCVQHALPVQFRLVVVCIRAVPLTLLSCRCRQRSRCDERRTAGVPCSVRSASFGLLRQFPAPCSLPWWRSYDPVTPSLTASDLGPLLRLVLARLARR